MNLIMKVNHNSTLYNYKNDNRSTSLCSLLFPVCVNYVYVHSTSVDTMIISLRVVTHHP